MHDNLLSFLFCSFSFPLFLVGVSSDSDSVLYWLSWRHAVTTHWLHWVLISLYSDVTDDFIALWLYYGLTSHCFYFITHWLHCTLTQPRSDLIDFWFQHALPCFDFIMLCTANALMSNCTELTRRLLHRLLTLYFSGFITLWHHPTLIVSCFDFVMHICHFAVIPIFFMTLWLITILSLYDVWLHHALISSCLVLIMFWLHFATAVGSCGRRNESPICREHRA